MKQLARSIEQMVAPEIELLTVLEAAEQLKCSRALIYALCERGKLPHHRLGNGRGTIRISTMDLAAFLNESRVEPKRITTTVGLKHIRLASAASR